MKVPIFYFTKLLLITNHQICFIYFVYLKCDFAMFSKNFILAHIHILSGLPEIRFSGFDSFVFTHKSIYIVFLLSSNMFLLICMLKVRFCGFQKITFNILMHSFVSERSYQNVGLSGFDSLYIHFKSFYIAYY